MLIWFAAEHGYTVWLILLLLLWLVVLNQTAKEPLTPEENHLIMESLEHRKNSFLMNRTVSRWGED